MGTKQFCYYKGKINYHRTDDLNPDALPNGSVVHLQYSWIGDDDSPFGGQKIYVVAENGHWLPECDLIITERVTYEDYLKATNVRLKSILHQYRKIVSNNGNEL